MKHFYEIDTLGDTYNSGLCMLEDEPEGLGLRGYRLATGDRARDIFPEHAIMRMSDSYPGIVTPSLIGNVISYLIVSTRAKDIIESLCSGCDIEYFQLTLYNHKGRVHTTDYWIVNPIGGVDCIDFQRSDITYLGSDIVSIERRVLATSKLQSAPHLFRILHDSQTYIASDALVRVVRDVGLTNFIFREITQSDVR